MQKLHVLLFTFILLPSLLSAKPDWQRIYPVKDCMNFHLVYYKQGSKYYLTYPVNVGGKEVYKSPYIEVKSINDLSSIADVIAREANLRCSQTIGPAHGDASCNALDNLDPDFIRLVQDAANAVGKTGDKCAELTRYIELHDKMVGLDPKNPVEISGASNLGNAILKVFANSTDDKLIDHFEECGGKTNSHKFIKNLLLVETHRSCIMPKPPGILSWDEMRKIAATIAWKYKNKGILTIRDEKPQIEKDALLEITRMASMGQIKELIPNVDPDKALRSLESYQNLQKAKKLGDLKNYIKLVYTPDASIEIAEKSLEGLVHENMMSKLPDDWSESKKKQYINDHLMPKALAGFNECMKEPKQRANYGHKAAPEINLNFRSWQKKEFCKKYRSTCIEAEKPGCPTGNASVNVLSMDPNVSDAEVAKSCVMNGMARTIEPIFAITLATQVDSFKKDVDLPPNLAKDFTASSWAQFQGCINTHPITHKMFKGTTYQPIYRTGGTNADAFRKMHPDEFKQLYSECSDKVEEKLTRDFVEVIFISNENVTENNSFGSMINFHGKEYPAGAVQYTQDTVKKNLDKCYERQNLQNKSVKGHKPSPTLCTPLLEIEVAKSVIDGKLRKMFEEKKLQNDSDAQKIVSEFRQCSNNAYNEALGDISNSNADPALKDPEDVKPYMENNKSFYNCVESALTGTARLIAGKEYRDTIKKKRAAMHNYSSILRMDKEVQEVVGKCFEEELKNKVGSWPKFKDFNTQDGLTGVENKCSKAATKYAVPRIMLKETYSEVQKIKKDGLIGSDNDVSTIIIQAAGDIKGAFNIEVDPKLKGNDYLHHVFGEGLEAYLKKYPKATQDDYLNYFKTKVTKRVIEKVHDKLVSRIKASAKSKYGMDLSPLDSSLTSSCVLDLYNNLNSGEDQKPKSKSSDPLDLEDLTSQIVEGFWYLKQSPPPAFQQQMNKISDFCKNAKSYSSVEEIKKTGLLDFVVKAQIHGKTVVAFKAMVMESYNEEVKKYKGTDYYHKIRPFLDTKLNDMLSLIQDKLEDRGAFEKMMFPGGRSPIVDFAIENSEEATKEGSAANRRLNQMVMEQMFKDRSKHSFASEFTGIQLVNSVGMEGYREAELALYAGLKDHPSIATTVFKYGKQSLDRNWTVAKVHSRFGYNELPDFARQDLIKAVYAHAITPVVRGDNATEVAREKTKLAKKVGSHLDGWHRKGKTFKEEFSDEITRETESEIKSKHKGEAFKEALGRWFSW